MEKIKIGIKIYLRLESANFTKEQQESVDEKLFPVDFPVMPRRGESIDCDRTLIKNLPLFAEEYFWAVDFISYEKKDNKYIPIVMLDGVL